MKSITTVDYTKINSSNILQQQHNNSISPKPSLFEMNKKSIVVKNSKIASTINTKLSS